MTNEKDNLTIHINEVWCKGCGICVAFCPKKVLAIGANGKVEMVDREKLYQVRHVSNALSRFCNIFRRKRLMIKFMQGNEACVEGALMAGMRFYSGYPITPSTEIAELSAERLPKKGGKFIQMEDEISGIAAAIGASLTGKKINDGDIGAGIFS